MSEPTELPVPNKITVYQTENEMEIVCPWLNVLDATRTLKLIFSYPVLLFICSKIPIPYLFQIVVVFVIVSSTKLILNWINKTHITVTNSKITVRHKPYPWFGMKTVFAHEIKQLKIISAIRSEANREHLHGATSYYRYSVKAVLTGGKERALMTGSVHLEEAEFIKAAIEKVLHLSE